MRLILLINAAPQISRGILTSAITDHSQIIEKLITFRCLKEVRLCADPEREAGGPDPPPPEISQKYRVSSNTGSDPLKMRKATKPAFNTGPSSARQ